MATRNIPIWFPDGQEDELIEEIATHFGWTAESGLTVSTYFRKVLVGMANDALISSRKKPAVDTVVDTIESEVLALGIS